MPVRFATPAPEVSPFNLLVGHILDGAVAAHPDQEIVYRDSARYSYRQLGERVRRLANVLAGLGVEPGDTVAVMDWDSHRYLEAYFAVPMMGAVLQTVNLRLARDQIAFCLRGAGAKVLLVCRDFLGLAQDLAAELPALQTLVPIDDGAADTVGLVPQGPDYESRLGQASTAFAFPQFDENALATTFHTTGTTGDPKQVSFSHRQLVLHTLALATTLANQPPGQELRRGDVYMPLTPMFHVHAWGVPYVATLLGVKHVYPGRYDPATILQLRLREEVTFSHCVPTILQMVLDAAALAGHDDLGPWTMIIGGSALPESLHLAAQGFGITALAGYGMSETGPAIAIARHDLGRSGRADGLRRAGQLLPLVQARIVDEAMEPLARDGVQQGELVLRAPWLTQSYVGDPVATDALWRGGWMHTQDIASIDAEGRVTLRDRLKDVIKSGGEWVSSSEVEDLLGRHPSVAEVAVIGVADARWGERPLAVVVTGGAAVSKEDLRAYMSIFVEKGHISRFAIPGDFVFLQGLPRTSVGKIDKKALRQDLADRFAPAVGATAPVGGQSA